jgi:UDP-glucose 4-epimerase
VIAIFKELYEVGKPLTVRKPGNQRRNFTHVEDIVEGLIRVGEGGSGDEYGLGHPDSYSILELAELFLSASGDGQAGGGKIEWLPERPGNRMDSRVDTRRTERELGWKPNKDLREYISNIVSSLKNEG